MTTIIIVIAAIAIVAGLISKMSKKGSSESPGSGPSEPKLRSPRAQALAEKAIKMSPEMGVGDVKLYLPPLSPSCSLEEKKYLKMLYRALANHQ